MQNREEDTDIERDDIADIIEAAKSPYTPYSEGVEPQPTTSTPSTPPDTKPDEEPKTSTEGKDNTNPTTQPKKSSAKKRTSKKSGVKRTQKVLKTVVKILKHLNPFMFVRGKVVSIEFFFSRWKVITVILVLMLFYISNRYICQQRIAEIGVLKKEKKEIGYKDLNTFTKLKLIKREESLQDIIEERGIDLEYPKTPPYVIENE